MADNPLLQRCKELARKEKQLNAFKKRLWVKGRFVSKSETKKGNIKLVLKGVEYEYEFLIMKSHKDKYALVQKLSPNTSIWAEGVVKLRNVICTRIKVLEKGFDGSKQTTLLPLI